MSKHKQTEPKTAGAMAAAVTAAPRTKRYDEAFKKAAVENWIRTGRSGTRIAHELGALLRSKPNNFSVSRKRFTRRFW